MKTITVQKGEKKSFVQVQVAPFNPGNWTAEDSGDIVGEGRAPSPAAVEGATTPWREPTKRNLLSSQARKRKSLRNCKSQQHEGAARWERVVGEVQISHKGDI